MLLLKMLVDLVINNTFLVYCSLDYMVVIITRISFITFKQDIRSSLVHK